MEAPGKEFGFYSKSSLRVAAFQIQCFRSLGKEGTLTIPGLRADFQLVLEGSSRVGRAQHKEKAKQEATAGAQV